MNSIKCQVLNCQFNARGSCGADAIEVKPQGRSAASSLGTFCETFIPSDEDDSILT